MFTFRTLTAVGLALVLTAGTYACDKKGRSGMNHTKAKVQQPKQSHTSGSLAGIKLYNYQVSSLKDAPKSRSSTARYDPCSPYLSLKHAPETGAPTGFVADDPFFFDALKFAPKSRSPAARYSFGATPTGPYVKEPRMPK